MDDTPLNFTWIGWLVHALVDDYCRQVFGFFFLLINGTSESLRRGSLESVTVFFKIGSIAA